jgi:protein-S-isoprenylcysteine O-methyltransferase Ste14
VPLSEHEQRLLEQLERALQDEDPKFASALQGDRLRRRLKLRLLLACVGMLLGIAALVYGLVATHHLPALEIAGGAVFVGCAWIAWTCWRRMPAPGEIVPAVKAKAARRASTGGPRGGFMQRMELRWQQRRERDGF